MKSSSALKRHGKHGDEQESNVSFASAMHAKAPVFNWTGNNKVRK